MAADYGSNYQAPNGTTPATTSFPLELIPTPTYAELCPGFISKYLLPDANYIIGGMSTPRRPTSVARSCICGEQGTRMALGTR